MSQTSTTPSYPIASDEKSAHVMVYTINNLYWGEVVTKELIRVSTWLRTNSVPDRINLYNAHAINIISGGQPRPQTFTDINLALSQILAFHLVPPAKDPLDYDPTEPNRKMEPVTLLVSTFRIDGSLRLSAKTPLAKFLEVTRENYTGVYDAKITNLAISGLGTISVPFLLVRQENTVFTHA